MFKVCHFVLFFILIIFMATSVVVSSPSLYNGPGSSNVKTAFATTYNKQGQEQQQEQPSLSGQN